jgi:hypothetical protein
MKTFFRFASAALLLSILTLVACEDIDDPDGTDVREKYVSTWTCQESGGISYPVTITLDEANSTQILIANFHYLGSAEKAYAIATTNNITIPSQELCGNTINGSGTLDNPNKITMKYYVNNHSTIDTVNATYSK